MDKTASFVIRVYGIVVNPQKEVLLSDEFVMDIKMTKFPGGGLQFGEGVLDCLAREFREECNGQEIVNPRHFYTTDFFQESFFHKNAQIISIYYLVELKPPVRFRISEKEFDFEEMKNGNQSFRWKKIKDLTEDDITLPIDKFVFHKLKKAIDE